MTSGIAIVGMACRYPDAKSPAELWENVLAGRRAFRRIPPERLSADYFSPARDAPDRTYCFHAALIENYEFDRARFNISGNTYRSTDLAHWLALDVAAQAIADSGLQDDLPRESTAVYVGNTLTGEFSRANTLRLRWPYVRRIMAGALAAEGWLPNKVQGFLDRLEESYKQPFPPVSEDTLAGGLSNTIAGRISNYFDFKGGGYTVDGACASSLLAVTTACSALAAGDIDMAVAGGVDLSIDPFELIGFAKSQALADGEMRVFDARSAGFLPGEGCGFMLLMRHADARARHLGVYAAIRGWGVSSDGSGGISRPEPEGQLLAIKRAYARAGCLPSTTAYVEGHGTGTAVGDSAELLALSRARRDADPGALPAALGSIKANIGHTKAAAGIAGLMKAAMAVHTQILPPTTACDVPHAELTGPAPALRVLRAAESWPAESPLRASASAMGFGGINTHIVLEGTAKERRREISAREQILLSSPQDAELFLFRAPKQIARLAAMAAQLSRAELTDASAALARTPGQGSFRAAAIASTPEELAERLAILASHAGKHETTIDVHAGIFAGNPTSPPTIGFLFPGQGSLKPQPLVQPAIVQASIADLDRLRRLSLHAAVAIGHSLGELTALHWAGALDAEAAIAFAARRDNIMSNLVGPPGAMAGVALPPDEAARVLEGEPVVIAACNTPRQTVVSGEAAAVDRIVAGLRSRGIPAVRLPVAQAFHSRLMESAQDPLAEYLAGMSFHRPERRVFSTITGAELAPDADLRHILLCQVTSPVRFAEALAAARKRVDLWIELGPGSALSGMVGERAVPIDTGARSVKGLLAAFAAAFVLGAPVNCEALFTQRFSRPFNGLPKLFASPCELPPAEANRESAPAQSSEREPLPPLDLVRQLIAERTELPLSAIQASHRLLSDLHLNSITVAQLAAEAARRCNVPPPVSALRFADGTVAEVAQMLEAAPMAAVAERTPAGVDSWIRAFTVEMRASPLPKRTDPVSPASPAAWQYFIAGHGLLQPVPDLPSTGGVLLCLPRDAGETHIPLMLRAVRAALACPPGARFVLVQDGGSAAPLARTLHLESGLPACVIDLPLDHPRALEWIAAEAHAAAGYTEAHYDTGGNRQMPVACVASLRAGSKIGGQLNTSDVLLVTGGGKGIAAECALAVARETGARLVLVGRSDPARDAALAANLGRMRAAGAEAGYIVADVTDATAIATAFREVESTLGPVTAILHGAGINTPGLLSMLEKEAFEATLAPKLQGLRNLLRSANPDRLRLLIAFGSIIARTGLEGEGHYAVANEWMARAVEDWRSAHSRCRCLTVDWSVWSGLGMGERLNRVAELERSGITPITPDEGVRMFKTLLSCEAPSRVIVSGRFGDLPTLRYDRPELPFARFLERPRVYYPAVELIADVDLSSQSDPYLQDHVLEGTPLLPAVMGLEAMAQVAGALCGVCKSPIFENVRFSRALPIPDGATVTLRICALLRAPGVVELVIRSSETAFQIDHFQAVCRFEDAGPSDTVPRVPRDTLPIDPAKDLYGSILFQTGRFRRLRAYRQLRSTECVAEIASETVGWFARYLPAALALGDPGARDASIHCVQACIPHAIVLPTAVARIEFGQQAEPGLRYVHAREQSSNCDLLTYNLNVTDASGVLTEKWEGLQLRIVGTQARKCAWVAPLLGPYLERRIREMAPGAGISVAIGRNGSSHQAIAQALGHRFAIHKRPDGKPEVNGHPVSASYAGDVVGAVAGTSGCDLQTVSTRTPAVWRDLLGPSRFALAELIARENGDDPSVALTRVWGAVECLKKAGALEDRPLLLAGVHPDGWVELTAGRSRILTYRAALRNAEAPLAFAVLIEAAD